MSQEIISRFTGKMILANNIILQALKEFSEAMKKNDIIAEKKELFKITVSGQELEILFQSLGARKKLLRGKIRNNQTHMIANDRPEWNESDYKKTINMRKTQLADADMLLTKLENL